MHPQDMLNLQIKFQLRFWGIKNYITGKDLFSYKIRPKN